MAGMLGFLAGGLAEGTGQGMVLEGKQMREDALKALEHDRSMQRDAAREEAAGVRQERSLSASKENLELTIGAADTRAERSDARADSRAQRAADAAAIRHNQSIEAEAQKVTKTVQGEDGRWYGVTSIGKKVDLDVKGAPPALAKSDQMPADVKSAEWLAGITARSEGREVNDKDRLAAHKQVNKAKDNPIAYAGVVARLYDAKVRNTMDRRPDSEKMAEAKRDAESLVGKEPEGGFDEGRFSRARSMAEREAEERTGVFSSRGSEFPETKGSMEGWINQRTQELYGQLGGTGKPAATGGAGTTPETGTVPKVAAPPIEQAAPPVDEGRAPPRAPAAKSGAMPTQTGPAAPGREPQGMGTRQNPYKAVGQMDIEWFKQTAPKGAVMEINGKLYTK
jgi:hypothetical protein